VSKQQLVRAIIVDDEIKACYNLKDVLDNYIVDSRIEIVGIANNTREAEFLIEKLNPDALFLDIEMPQENAFQFLDRITSFNFEIIFVTAYDAFAIKALKLNALDYILKPISILELKIATQKLVAKIEHNRILNQYEGYRELSDSFKHKKSNKHIKLRTLDAIYIVLFEDILFIEALGAYSKFHFKTNDTTIKEVTMSHTISEYEDLLPKELFFRVHRSFFVNTSQVDNLKVEDNSLKVIINQHEIPISRRRMSDFLDFYSSNK
jgi:two-component system, LytTR family, response regulator